MNVSMESNYAQLKAVQKAHLFPDNCRSFAPVDVPTVEALKDEQPSLYGHVDVAHVEEVLSERWPKSQWPGFLSLALVVVFIVMSPRRKQGAFTLKL